MGRRRYKSNSHASTEFELDLAPLLAVMVKLVPVLLISSAFVQMMVVETELPQVIKEAIEQQEQKTKTQITLEMKTDSGFDIVVKDESGKESTINVPQVNQKWDYKNLHLQLREVKKQNPNIFKLNFAPGEKVSYQDLIKATDEARKSRDPQVLFEVEDLKKNKKSKTDYMFPEVIFVNMMEG
jgi:biopolymer transport protein ExbD